MIEYPKEYYIYLNKACDKTLTDEERLHYLDLANEVAKPLEDRLAEFGMVA